MCNQGLCCCGNKERHNCAEFPRSLTQFVLPKIILRIPISMWKRVYLRGALINRLKSCTELSEFMLLIKGLEKIVSCKREDKEGPWCKLIKSNWFQLKQEQCRKITGSFQEAIDKSFATYTRFCVWPVCKGKEELDMSQVKTSQCYTVLYQAK